MKKNTRANKKPWFVVLYDGGEPLSIVYRDRDLNNCQRYACLHNSRWMKDGFAVVVGELPQQLAS